MGKALCRLSRCRAMLSVTKHIYPRFLLPGHFCTAHSQAKVLAPALLTWQSGARARRTAEGLWVCARDTFCELGI